VHATLLCSAVVWRETGHNRNGPGSAKLACITQVTDVTTINIAHTREVKMWMVGSTR
jgi:hypothetical protein